MAARAPVRPRGRSASVARSRPARGEAPRARVVEMQRSRILAAALGAVDELGYAHTTVAHVTRRARVSRRTFYELYSNREDCLLAALDSVVELIAQEFAGAHLEEFSWRERVRAGLWTILSFFDREPVLARACVIQALRGGPRVLERREQVLARLAGALDGGRSQSARGNDCPPLTAEGLVGAAFAVVYGRLLRGDGTPLTDLHGELMGMIVLPYLGPAAAKREQDRHAPAPDGVTPASRKSPVGSEREEGGGASDPLAGLPMRLTYRTALVLEAIAAGPGVSNRGVGERAGVPDQGQISKLLSRLQRLGLIANSGAGHSRGEANAWTLTPTGVHVARGLGAGVPAREGAES